MRFVRSIPASVVAGAFLAVSSVASAQGSAVARLSCLFGGTPPLTGISAGTGKPIVNGGDLAAEQATRDLGIDVKVSWRDGQNLPAATVSGFQALAAENAVGVLVNGTGPLLAAAPIAERSQRIVFNIAAVTPAQRTMNPYVFGNAVLADTESRQIVETAKSVLKASRVAIVHDDDAFGDMFRKYMTEAAAEAGLTVTHTLAIKPGAADLRPQLRALLDVPEHQAVMLATTGVTPGTAIKQAKDMGVKSRYWIGEQFTWVPDALKAAGPAADGAIATTPLFDPSASPRARQFAQDYEKRFGTPAEALAGRAYDAIYAMALAARNAGSCDSTKVRDELVKLKGFDGVTGTLDFSKRIAEGKLTWGRVKGGAISAVQPGELAAP
jgi:branched-chain amino acid transport system substrate-binding protein